MKVKPSRFEINKVVRQILARHSVDTTLLDFQTFGFDITIQGILWHNDNSDFNGAQVEALVQDFTQFLPDYQVRGDMENWSFSNRELRRVHGVLEEGDTPTIDEHAKAIGEGNFGGED